MLSAFCKLNNIIRRSWSKLLAMLKYKSCWSDIATIHHKIHCEFSFDGRKVVKIPQKQLIEEFSKRIIKHYDKNTDIEKTLEKALNPYFKV